MAVSYDVTQLATSKLYQVRLRLGDTDIATAEFQDEELEFFLSESHNNVLSTCIKACSAALSKIAHAVDYSLGPYSESSGSDRFNRWITLQKSLQAEAASTSCPLINNPTTEKIFSYDMMSRTCCIEGEEEL